MNSAQLAKFAAKAANQRAGLFGTQIIFRGMQITVPRPSTDPDLSMDVGGYRPSALYRFRFPASVQPPPSEKETITQLATGQRYHVATCVPALGDSSSGAEHIVEAKLAS